ncbi:phosphoribosyl transferase-like protein [Sediminihabitans luteus]|uniref:Phosphoribosyl transferase-like protein n=1 Tax=Sediminihabitans luteus TaxID=1138585 RepID=A0A2M9CC12_9CELL|nr:phosphoribosyltransferase family protein [Sediminihabitans luteus]PJJ68591.1 phosphoribosyl transferase-like protein [Sediminihabitans luteus]GII99929.1 hypothetical protein Slu03_23070 [Sediminihabitans luteus]
MTAPALVAAFHLTRAGRGVGGAPGGPGGPGGPGAPGLQGAPTDRAPLVDARSGLPLDVDAYSRMKHGDARAARDLADAVADALLVQQPALVTDPAPLALPVAYLAVRPACWYLAARVLDRLDAERARHGHAPGRVVRVAKDSVTRTDYAASSAADRRAEMDRIGFRLTQDVAGCQLVVVDDVRVTGLAEATVLAALADAGAVRTVVAYVATVDDALRADPAVEAELNHATVRSVADMADVVRAGDFVLTIRFLKRLLGAPAAERAAFLDACPPALVAQMHAGCVATGPEFCAGYADGVADLVARRGPGQEAGRGASDGADVEDPDAVHPDAVHPDAVHPDAVHPDAVHPDAVHPDAVHPDAVHTVPAGA